MNDAPLRAFLMLRSGEGDWNVTVCRGLGAVIQAWKARTDAETTVGILHVGFDRSPSRIYESVAANCPVRMLLTASAKYALPASFVSSKNPVGFAEGQGIFMGLQGWGYEIDDPTLSNSASPFEEKTATPELQGWLALFAAANPGYRDALADSGIFDDETYLRKESGLDRDTKHKLGEYRLRTLVSADCEDPCEIARASPPWLMERELTSLDLTVRANNVFKNNNIKTVRDLSAWTPTTLLGIQNFGRKSLKDASIGLAAALAEGPVWILNGQDLSNSSRLLVEVRRSLRSFPERERDVVARRLGFERPPETLQEVADDHNVTRERIRQIEARSLQKWIRESFWDDVLVHKLARLLTGRQSPLPVAGIEGVDDWFEGVTSHMEFFQNLVKVVCEDRISVIEIDGVHYLTLMTQSIWEKTVSAAEDLLSSAVGRNWTESYAQSLIYGLLPDNAKEFGAPLWDAAVGLCHFSAHTDGSRTLTSYGRGADQIVEAVLAASPVPLHYSEIAEQAKVKHGREIEVRRAHNAASSVGFLFGPGVYGLARHIPLNEEEMSEVRAETEEIVLSEPGRQWHCSELMGVLLERLDREYVGLDKYVLNIALRQSKNLKWLHKMTWVAKDQESNEQARIDIHQAIVAFIKAAGHPLTADEIKQNLFAVRGVNNTFAINAFDPLIRVGRGLWGINDRDVPINRADQRIYIDLLVEHLEGKQSGMYPEEVADLLELKEFPIETFFSILTQDSRLKVSTGRCVYLAKWGEPRRETVGRAVQAVLEEASEPLQLEVIMQLVAMRIARPCEKSKISAALQAIGAVYNEDARTWAKADMSFDNTDDDDEQPALSNDNRTSPQSPAYSIQAGSV
jgi:hypothetical protein